MNKNDSFDKSITLRGFRIDNIKDLKVYISEFKGSICG